MREVPDQLVVRIGVAWVVPREGCELPSPHEGAFVNFLRLASSDSEYRAKVTGAISFYLLDLLEFQDVFPLSQSDRPSQEILSIAPCLEWLEKLVLPFWIKNQAISFVFYLRRQDL